ncbi:MAG: SAM-dependent methyltransferase [Propionibacteriaceae bacterium]
MLPYFRPWLDAWVESAYGEGGFWRTERPRDHFRTASSSTSGLASWVVALLGRHPEITLVVETGAGDGMLLDQLCRQRPDLTLCGVDLGSRPDGLAAEVGWCSDVWDVTTGQWSGPAEQLLAAIDQPCLLLAVEWFDDLPCQPAVRQSSGACAIDVDPSGTERTGDRLGVADQAWLEQWWPVGSRLEVGRTRDQAWRSLLGHLQVFGGLALVVDYGHLCDSRPDTGSLQAFRGGRQVRPAPRSDRNLTAAVAIDALADAGQRVGATTEFCSRQGDVLGAVPGRRDQGPLAALVSRSEHAALVNPAVWGDQWWLLQRVAAAPERATSAGS